MSNKLRPLGYEFEHKTTVVEYVDACTGCGRVRIKGETDYSYNSEQYCANCGKSYRGESVRITKPLYVIGHFKRWDGKEGYMLSETDMSKTSTGACSYWSYLEEELGIKYSEQSDPQPNKEISNE